MILSANYLATLLLSQQTITFPLGIITVFQHLLVVFGLSYLLTSARASSTAGCSIFLALPAVTGPKLFDQVANSLHQRSLTTQMPLNRFFNFIFFPWSYYGLKENVFVLLSHLLLTGLVAVLAGKDFYLKQLLHDLHHEGRQ